MQYRIRKVYFSKDESPVYYPDYKTERMITWRSGNVCYVPEQAELQILLWRKSKEDGRFVDIVEERVLVELNE